MNNLETLFAFLKSDLEPHWNISNEGNLIQVESALIMVNQNPLVPKERYTFCFIDLKDEELVIHCPHFFLLDDIRIVVDRIKSAMFYGKISNCYLTLTDRPPATPPQA